MRKISIVILIITLYSCTTTRMAPLGNIQYVPDQETATRVAEAIWLPIYGKKIYEEKPFKAILKNGIWYVEGVHTNHGDSTLYMGGVAYIEIRQSDCKVIKVFHTK